MRMPTGAELFHAAGGGPAIAAIRSDGRGVKQVVSGLSVALPPSWERGSKESPGASPPGG